MKKIVLYLLFTGCLMNVSAQSHFEVKDFGTFKLHSYITADPLGDINYIVETNKGLVIIEPPAFKENIQEMNTYIQKLNKPLVKVIADYHIAGYEGFDKSMFVQVEGMPAFSKGEIYGGMMKNFSAIFQDKMDTSPYGETAVISRNSTQNWAGIRFTFAPGTSSDFPASSIVVGKKVYYTHFTPTKAHPSPLQLHSKAAINAVLAELNKVISSGCKVVIGGHGAATADLNIVRFEIQYLNKTKELLSKEPVKERFIQSLKAAYPDLAGAENLDALAANYYK